jgi:NAD kinase
MVHPLVQAMLLTPINQRPLALKPMILPPQSTTSIAIPANGRMEGVAVFDGVASYRLERGDQLHIRIAPHALYSYTPNDVQVKSWLQDVSMISQWNLPQV